MLYCSHHHSAEIFAFLLSTRAGGLGINLTAADTVSVCECMASPPTHAETYTLCSYVACKLNFTLLAIT